MGARAMLRRRWMSRWWFCDAARKRIPDREGILRGRRVAWELPFSEAAPGWMFAEDLDAAMLFWLLVKSISDCKGNHEGVWCWGALLTEAAFGKDDC